MELKGVLLRQQKAQFCWILWRWRIAAETSQGSAYSSVSVRHEENALLSRDKILGFKRKMHFWKTSHYKKEIVKCFHCCLGLTKEGYHQVSTLTRNHLEKLRTKVSWFSSLSTQMITGQNSFSESSDYENLPWEKGRAAVLHKMSFTDLPQTSSGFLWRKEYPAIHKKPMNTMFQFSTSHTNNLFLTQWTSRVS